MPIALAAPDLHYTPQYFKHALMQLTHPADTVLRPVLNVDCSAAGTSELVRCIRFSSNCCRSACSLGSFDGALIACANMNNNATQVSPDVTPLAPCEETWPLPARHALQCRTT